MIPLRRMLVTSAAYCALMGAAVAAQSILPLITGELSGHFSAQGLTGFPGIEWKIVVREIGQGQRHADFLATAAGGRLQAEAEYDAVTGDGSWKIIESNLDAAVWFPVFAPGLGSAVKGITAIGKLHLSGTGPLKKGWPTGSLELGWTGGALRHATGGWSLDDIALRGEYVIDAEAHSVKSATPLDLTVRTITTKRFGARNVFIRGLLNEGGTFSLLEAKVEIAGGVATIDPCTIPLSPLVLDLTLHIDRIGLQDVVALVPESLSDARGRVDGVARLGWSAAAGIQIGTGHLALRNDEPAMVRLTATPGFLTHRLPERIVFLPKWTGPLAQWLSPVNPAYGDLKEIEMGRADLRVQTLTIDLTPEGDGLGRTASVFVSARPLQAAGTVKEVTFQVNVLGPFGALMRAGIRQNMSLQFH